MIEITGYIENGVCEHCGRSLRHCIVTDAGVVGATCFDKQLTKPKIHNGKKYRVGSKHIIRLAKIAEFSADPTRYGVYPEHFKFEKAIS